MSDAVRRFWMEWLEADELGRPKMLEKLARMGMSEYLNEAARKGGQELEMFCKLWNSYFEDFVYSISQEIERRKMHPAQMGTSVKK